MEAGLSKVVTAVRDVSPYAAAASRHLRDGRRRHAPARRVLAHAVAEFGAAVRHVDRIGAADQAPVLVQDDMEVAHTRVLLRE